MPRYQFKCSACKHECVGSIGAEHGINCSKVSMLCGQCEVIDIFTVPKKGSIDHMLVSDAICKSCGSDKHLKPWDGLTCPHCKGAIRAIGPDVDIPRPSRFRW
ncbi:hypothetical protein B0G85_1623 [Polynucleobacter brandtiae]|uniref:Uncharacterized protein n=1 Tax=Polynucleobacter brandtiae TaxID=1938816 RepID=A0A2M8VQR2_9BURK|nr:hypothetical protein B0G85_1623 [Polynucleobacter brandtiae]